MQRQGMIVTIKQLRKLADILEKDLHDLSFPIDNPDDVKIQINIINKQDTSDTWEIEK